MHPPGTVPQRPRHRAPARRRWKPGASGHTILVVDDQVETLTSVRMLLEREGHRVLTAESGQAALSLLARESVQLALVDYFMPVMDGEELIHRIRERDSLVQIVLQTGYAGEKPPRDMLRRLAIQGYHDKSDGPDRLLLWVDVALKAYDQLARLRAAEQLKSALLANLSHEFRTPLNVIVGYVQLLREGAFGGCPPEAHPALASVMGSAESLLHLVEEFLSLCELEAGAVALEPAVTELGPLLRELGEAFVPRVHARPVEFQLVVPDDLPAVAAEKEKLRVVVQNLLANAEKFTAEGRIALAAAAQPGGQVEISVSDTGPGIAPEHREAVFDTFHQLPRPGGHGGGMGLGLSLARQLARVMGGDITVESTVGEGTTFKVVLPVAELPRHRRSARAPEVAA